MSCDDVVVSIVFSRPLIPLDDPAGIDVFREWAAHEAAHAVVTAALGVKVRRILVVQLTGAQKLAYVPLSPEDDKNDGSGSTPDKDEYENTTPINRCLIGRAGEVGQRLRLRAKDGERAEHGAVFVDPADWEKDRKDIKKETDKTLPEDEFSKFLDTLGTPIEEWLQEKDPNNVWKNLTEFLVATRIPWPNDPERARRELINNELQELLKDTPAFPADRKPAMPEAQPANEPEA